MDEALIYGTSREKGVAGARRMACYLLHNLLDLSFAEIGRVLNRDHSATMYMYSAFKKQIDDDPWLQLEVDRVIAELTPLPKPVQEERSAKLSDSPLENTRQICHAKEGSMLRGYYLACITETAIIAALLLGGFVMHPDHATSSDALAMMLTLIVAVVLTDVGVYCMNSIRSREGMSFGKKALIVLAAIETAFIAALVSFATMSLLTELDITVNSLLMLSSLAAAGLGPAGLICFLFAGRSTGWVDYASEKQ